MGGLKSVCMCVHICMCVCLMWLNAMPKEASERYSLYLFLSNLARTMWSFPATHLRAFVLPQKSGSAPSHSPGQRLGFNLAWRGCQPHSARWCHAYAHRGRAADGPAGGEAPFSSHSVRSLWGWITLSGMAARCEAQLMAIIPILCYLPEEKILSLTLFLPVSLSLTAITTFWPFFNQAHTHIAHINSL